MTNVRDIEPEPYVIPLSLDGREVLSCDPCENSGWAAYFQAEGPDVASAFLRFGARKDGPLSPDVPVEIRELRVIVEEGADLASGLLRTIPFDRIEAAVNLPPHREVLAGLVMHHAMVADSVPGQTTRYMLRPSAVELEKPDLALVIPEGYRKPDEFYRRVAELFLWLASVSSRPAQELAEANDVKPTTVHRWIREAKERGLLVLPWDRKTR